MFAPKLWQHYAEQLSALYNFHDDRCYPLFQNSIFPCCTWNLGPQCVCRGHCDSANLPHGWCAICSLGVFDHKKGGHLYLVELGLIIEFPPGSVILIPSSTVRHGNTPIADHETRYSFTLFAAGGLFRWVDHGYVPVWFLMQNGWDKAAYGSTTAKWKEALNLYSTVDSRHQDWLGLFG